MNAERLLNIARALRESPHPLNMDAFQICGTPACALGNYAHRTDLQSVFCLCTKGYGIALQSAPEVALDGYHHKLVLEHFDITEDEADLIFQAAYTDEDGEFIHESGCGGAENAIEAAEYIERFVAERPV